MPSECVHNIGPVEAALLHPCEQWGVIGVTLAAIEVKPHNRALSKLLVGRISKKGEHALAAGKAVMRRHMAAGGQKALINLGRLGGHGAGDATRHGRGWLFARNLMEKSGR